MTFLNPQFFWVMIFPLIMFAFLITTNKDKLSRIFDAKVLERLSAADESISVRVRNIIMLIALLLMVIAMARPVVNEGEKEVEVKGLTLLTALDISGSMRSKDVYPNRLEFAKLKMAQFFDALPSDEIGIMAFAYSSFVLAPFSSDKGTLKLMVDGVNDSYINMGSTDYAAVGELASSLLKEKKTKILVLFSDGGDEKAIQGFADILKAQNIDLYVVLVGTEKGAPVLDENGKSFKDKEGNIVIIQRNDALGKVATSTGGAYVIANNGLDDVKSLAKIIKNKYKMEKQGSTKIIQNVEYFYYPLGLALLLLLISFSSMPRREV